MHTYGALTPGWRGDNYSDAFPPATVVVEATLKIPHVIKKCSRAKLAKQIKPAEAYWSLPPPGKRVVNCRQQTPKEFKAEIDDLIKSIPPGPSCRDVTSIDENW